MSNAGQKDENVCNFFLFHCKQTERNMKEGVAVGCGLPHGYGDEENGLLVDMPAKQE